jgi:hypothetical protein
MRDGHSRVTDAERFGVLHDAADNLLDELAVQYAVERRDNKEPLAGADGPLVRTSWLVPRAPAAASLGVAFTDFPGVILRLGRWYQEVLPECGCDACDEDPLELVSDLRAHAGALVEGGLWERVHRRLTGSWSEARLVGPDFSTSQQALLGARVARAARLDGFAAAVQWAPWPAPRSRPRRLSRGGRQVAPRPADGH